MKEVPLSRGLVALVDDEDFELVSRFNWFAARSYSCTNYAVRRPPAAAGRSGRVAMHRFMLQPAPGMVIDHINGNGLDNRRSNLRVCTKSENSRNMLRSRNQRRGMFKGVHRGTGDTRWTAQARFGGKKMYLGKFTHPEEAALAYDYFARTHYGAFAACNYPDES